jgi:hypothetical protein
MASAINRTVGVFGWQARRHGVCGGEYSSIYMAHDRLSVRADDDLSYSTISSAADTTVYSV